MKFLKIEIVGFVFFVLMVFIGITITQDDKMRNVIYNEVGVKIAADRQKLQSTYPGIAMMACGTIIGVASIIKSKK
jgi:hypothetical protein